MSNPKNKTKTQQFPMKKLSPVSMVTELPPVRGHLRTSASNPNKPIHNEKGTSSAIDACVDRAFRIPIFLSTTNTVNDLQEQFLNRLIREIEDALLFP
ncbi:hypothetical protein CA599_31720, partial [Paenibacillus taichungensis]